MDGLVHGPDNRAKSGPWQAGYGPDRRLTYFAMGKGSTPEDEIAWTLDAIAENLQDLIDNNKDLKKIEGVTAKRKYLGDRAGVGYGTIRRLLAGTHTKSEPTAPGIDKLVRLAHWFNVSVHDLLKDNDRRSRLFAMPQPQGAERSPLRDLKRGRRRPPVE